MPQIVVSLGKGGGGGGGFRGLGSKHLFLECGGSGLLVKPQILSLLIATFGLLYSGVHLTPSLTRSAKN